MAVVSEQAVKAFYWSFDGVGKKDSWYATWVWLPYKVKEAFIQAIEAGLLTIIVPKFGRLDWPHWTDAGIEALSRLARLPKEDLVLNKRLDGFIWEPDMEVREYSDSFYLREWEAIAGNPGVVADQCIRVLLDEAYEGELGGLGIANDILPGPLSSQLKLIEEGIYHQASSGAVGEAVEFSADDMKRFLHEVIKAMNDLTTDEKQRNSIQIELFCQHVVPYLLKWAKSGSLPFKRPVPEEEVGFDLLAGRPLTLAADNDIWSLMQRCRWRDVRARIELLHTEGNARFETIDASLVAEKYVQSKA